LVPIDGSEHAEKALTLALEMAEKHEACIEILTVVPGVVKDPEWMKVYTEKMKENGEVMLSMALRKAKESKPEIKISKSLEEGVTVPKIFEVAKEGNHDIIIIGSRGLGFVKGFLLGSVSSKVVNQAEIPVLIVK
jgi:nucleotide-binding universal stress UspA family protein